MTDQPGILITVTFIGGMQATFMAKSDLHTYWRAIKADGFVSLPDQKMMVPFHMVASVQETPPEMLDKMQTGGSA